MFPQGCGWGAETGQPNRVWPGSWSLHTRHQQGEVGGVGPDWWVEKPASLLPLQALYVTDHCQAGTVFVNTYNKTDVAAPFGGFKQSGYGKDLGESPST